MKAIVSSVLVSICAHAAFAICSGEAQIIAKVEAVQPMPPNACFAQVSAKSVRFYSENKRCPLALSEVVHAGIEIGLRTEDHCTYSPGDEISGVIFEDVDGTIRLER